MSIQLLSGALGSFLSIVSTLPQLWKSRKNNSTSGLSPAMFLIKVFSSVCWILYGISLGGWLLAVEAAIVCLLQIIMVGFIIRDRTPGSPAIENTN